MTTFGTQSCGPKHTLNPVVAGTNSSQLQRMQTPCQIGYNRAPNAQKKNHLRLNQQDSTQRCRTGSLLLLRKDQLLSQRGSTICSLTIPKIPTVKSVRDPKLCLSPSEQPRISDSGTFSGIYSCLRTFTVESRHIHSSLIWNGGNSWSTG